MVMVVEVLFMLYAECAMQNVETSVGKSYAVTTSTACTITTPDGTVIAVCPVGQQTYFIAPTNPVVVSVDDAHVTESFRGAVLTVLGDGSQSSSESSSEPPLPTEALRFSTINEYFATNAQPGETQAPSAVYISAVPWARKVDGGWVNSASKIDEEAAGFPIKLMDNAGLLHECSTDTVEGVDDYNGKLWPFFWQHGNYVTDEYGVKHLSSIKGQEGFDPFTQNVAAFGPAFWFFCCLSKGKHPETGAWLTHDGTESGTPLFQFWGISTRSWDELDEQRRSYLQGLGISEDDFHLWPECLVWDAENNKELVRPYWIHSAYCGGAELQQDGSYMITSKKDLPLYNNLSHNDLNALYSMRAGFGGAACVQAFGLLFDIVKNGNKNSQSAHMGMSSNFQSAVVASVSTAEADYVFPIASQGAFEVGCTVQLMQASGNTWSMTYKETKAVQQTRIVAIETRELALADGTRVSTLCLVLDPATCEPFKVRVTAEAAKALSDAGEYAHCYVLQGMAMTGETDAVPYPHDGSMTSYTNGKHPYRTMGTEFLPGILMIAADVVAIRGTGADAVTIDGVTSSPASTEYVVLHAGRGVTRKASGSLSDYLEAGYAAVGTVTAKAGWILNMQLTKEGVAYPTAIGGSDSTGHADYLHAGASPAEFLVGGYASLGSQVGAAYVDCSVVVSFVSGSIGARD